MAVTTQPLTEETFPAASELVMEFWHRDWCPEFTERLLRWRFLQRPSGETLLVMEGDRCIAMIDSFLRAYLIDGEVTKVRELGDWYSRPEYRGVGLKPIRAMMKKPEPIMSIGGSQATQSLLPRLGWKPLANPATDFTLTVTAGAPVNALMTRLKIPGQRLVVPLANRLTHVRRWFSGSQAPGDTASVRRYDSSNAQTTVLPSGGFYQLASVIDVAEIDWLQQAPAQMGEFVALEFLLGDEVIGLSVSRVFQAGQVQQGNILQLQASNVSLDIYRWMVDETTSQLVARGVSSVRCRTSCHILENTLQALQFKKRDVLQTVWWSRDSEAPQGPTLLSRYRADDGIQPYPK